jgi:predicted permease
MAPLALLGVALALGADVPAPYYLAIAMPAAFHTLILARVFALPGAMMRLIVLLSTAIMLAAVFGWLVLFD